MIRKILIILTTIFIWGNSQAQICIPDTSLKTVGYKPDSLKSGKTGVAYSEVISVLAPKDTMVKFSGFDVKATIDSILLTNILGMPPGLTYSCENTNCQYSYKRVGCAKISGTPTSGGVFPLRICILGFAKVLGNKINQPDTVDRFRIIVDGPNGVYRLEENSIWQLKPNPAQKVLQIMNIGLLQPKDFQILDLNGKVLPNAAKAHQNSIQFEIDNLNSGVYIVRQGNYTQKWIKY